MAQLLRHPAKQHFLYWPQPSVAISSSSSPPGNSIIDLPDIIWRFGQARMLGKSSASESFPEMPQNIVFANEREPVKHVTDNRDHIIKKFDGQPNPQHIELVRSSLQDKENQKTVPERGKALETRTEAADHKMEPSSSVQTSVKGKSSKELNEMLKDILVRLKGDTKVIESKKNLHEKAPVGLNWKDFYNVPASSSLPSDSKKQVSAYRHSNTGQDSAGVPPTLELPECEAHASNQNVEKNDSINHGQGGINKSTAELMAACQPKTSHEISMVASNKKDFADNIPTSFSKEEYQTGINDVNVQIKVEPDEQNGTCRNVIGNAGPGSFPSEVESLDVVSKDKTTASSPAGAGFTVCVEQHPADIGICEIKSALSLYGDIVGSFRRTRNDGVIASFITFMTDEAKERALAAQWLHIGGKQLQIQRVDQFMTTVIRISNASAETTERKVLSACETCGRVDSVRRRGNGTFDVYFKLRELPNMSNILNRFHDVTKDQGKWKARPAPLLHPQAVKDIFKRREGLSWHFSQQVASLDRLEVAINSMVLDLQDMQELLDLVNQKGHL